MKNLSLFIVLTPLHVYIVKSLIEYLNIENCEILVTKKYIDNFAKNKVLLFDIAELQESKMIKILKLFNLRLKSYNKSYDKIFIPSDANPYIQIFLSKVKFQELNYFEEGGTLLYRIKEEISGKPQIRINFIKKLLGMSQMDNVLKDKRIQNAYVFFPEILQNLIDNINFIDLSNILKQTKFENMDIAQDYLSPDILIFTQPLTEDGYCKHYEEIKIIEQFIQNNVDKKIVIKLHPRDNMVNYEYFKRFGVSFMPISYQSIPYQVMHNTINPKSIVSFFSSILFSVESNRNDFTRVSLVNQLDNVEVKQFIIEMQKYLKNLEIK